MLKERDNSKRTAKPPVDSRDLVDEEDTFDPAAKEKELRDMLSKKSKKISEHSSILSIQIWSYNEELFEE